MTQQPTYDSCTEALEWAMVEDRPSVIATSIIENQGKIPKLRCEAIIETLELLMVGV